MASHNLRVYGGRLLSWRFQRRTELLASEASILRRLGAEFSNAEILDVGVGGGRTTAHLAQLSAKYTGIDYSPRMIAACRARYPTLAFEVCDARNLSRFADGRFGLVFFSLNGIDYVGHRERLEVLRETFRVLSTKGAFIFSSHNRDAALTKRPWKLSRLPFGVNPIKKPLNFLERLVSYPIAIGNYLLNRRHERQSEEYAILNDSANDYQMLTYYISIERQIAQLKSTGYTAIDVVGFDGRRLSPSEYGGCKKDPFLHYVCRR